MSYPQNVQQDNHHPFWEGEKDEQSGIVHPHLSDAARRLSAGGIPLNQFLGEDQQNKNNSNNNNYSYNTADMIEQRVSINNRLSDPQDTQRGKKKSKFNTDQQNLQQQSQQQSLQQQLLSNLKGSRSKHFSLFKSLKNTRTISNAFNYIDFQDKYHTWRDTHIDALECFVFFCESLLVNQTLSELNVSGIEYCDMLMEELCETLSLMPSMKGLVLSNVSLDCLSWRSISKYVGSSKTLERLTLRNNAIREECIRDFFNSFRYNSTLQELNLSNCTIEHTHINILLTLLANNRSIKGVNLSNGTLNDENAEGVAQFLSNCPKIKLLDISNNNLSRQFFERLNRQLKSSSHKKPKINSFDLGSNSFNRKEDDFMRHSSKSIDAIISILKKLKGVCKLNLSNNFLETEDIKRLNNESLRSRTGLVQEELDLSYNNINRSFPECFFQNIKLLNLKKNLLSLSSMEVISRTLKDDQTKWEVLDLSDNKLNNSGMEILINYLKENTKLKELYCSSNEIEGVGMISIIINNERMNLEKIDLSDNRFTLNSVISYLNSLKNQVLSKIVLNNFDEHMKTQKGTIVNDSKIIFDQPFSLDLSRSTILAQHIFKGFERHLPKFVALNLSNCVNLQEEDIKRLAYLISHSHILAKLNLEDIPLGSMSIDCLTILGQSFGNNRCLKELKMNRCRLSVRFGIVGRELGNVTSLEDLDISENNLSDGIGDVLRTIVQKCFHLSHLNISSNGVGNGCLQAIMRGLKGNSSLKKLSMGNTNITAGEMLNVAQLLRDCRHLKNLDISTNQLLLITTNTINTLQLKPDTILLKAKKIADQQEVNSLRTLFEHNAFTKSLLLLDLDTPPILLAKILDGIPNLSNLKNLAIKSPMMIQQPSLNQPSLPSGQSPIFPQSSSSASPQATPSGIVTGEIDRMAVLLTKLSPLNQLNKLCLTKIPLSLLACQALSTMISSADCQVRYLLVSEEILTLSKITSLANGISTNKSITKLKLRDDNISSDEAAILAKALVGHTSIQLLDLSFNKIPNKGTVSIIESLKNNPCFQEFIFSGQKEPDPTSAQTIALSIQAGIAVTDITKLVLRNSRLRLSDLEVVLPALKNHPSLLHFDISENILSDECCEKLKEFLEQNQKLKQLILRRCEISVTGFESISKGACRNNILEALDLRENTDEGDKAMESFQRFLHETHLKFLGLSGNNIGGEGNQFIYQMIRSRMKLFVYNDWVEIQDELAIELFMHLIFAYNNPSEAVQCLTLNTTQAYAHVDFSRGQLTDRFCLFLTENLRKCTGLETLDLRNNSNITQTGMKHVFTAVFDTRKDESLRLVAIQFSQRHKEFERDDSDNNRNRDNSYKPDTEQDDRKQFPSTSARIGNSHTLDNLPHPISSVSKVASKSRSSKNSAINAQSQNFIIPSNNLNNPSNIILNNNPDNNIIEEAMNNNNNINNAFINENTLNNNTNNLNNFNKLRNLPSIKKKQELSTWQKISRLWQRNAQFVNENVRWQLEYKFDYANNEKLKFEQNQKRITAFLCSSFALQVILTLLPFLNSGSFLRGMLFVMSFFLVVTESACYVLYLYLVHVSETDAVTCWGKAKCILSKLKFFDFVLLMRGLAHRADSILSSQICVFYINDNYTYLIQIYMIILVIKVIVIIFFTVAPFADWLHKKANKSIISKDKQYLDLEERLCMVFGMSLLEQIFALFNPGASAIFAFGGKKKPQRAVINIWSKKVFESVYLILYICPLFVLYFFFYTLFTDPFEQRVLVLGISVLGLCFIFSFISFITTHPTFIQQADFNHALNIRKFSMIEKLRSKHRVRSIRATISEYLRPRETQMSYPLPSSLRNTQLMRLAKEGVITADLRIFSNKDQQIVQEVEHAPLISNQQFQNEDNEEIFIDPYESMQGSIPIEIDSEEPKKNTINENYFDHLKKLKDE